MLTIALNENQILDLLNDSKIGTPAEDDELEILL